VTERRGRRCRKLLDDFKERRGYCHLKEEAVDRTVWRAGFGRECGPAVRQTAEFYELDTRDDTFASVAFQGQCQQSVNTDMAKKCDTPLCCLTF
jgi:hypothetical protein